MIQLNSIYLVNMILEVNNYLTLLLAIINKIRDLIVYHPIIL